MVVAACDVAVTGDPATCGGQTGYHKVTVKVIDIDERGTVTLDDAAVTGTDPLQYLVGITLTATAKDGDIQGTQTFIADVEGAAGTQTGVSGVTWRWYRGGTEIPNESGNTYTLQPADARQPIRAKATYQVDGATGQEMAEGTTAYPVLAARSGNNMLKFDPATVNRSISEGGKGRNVGAPVTVKAGSNHGAVAYTLTGTIPQVTVGGTPTDAFSIDRKTGQIKTLVALNYDGTPSCPSNTCTVMVRATDASGATTDTASTAANVFDDATVTIKVTNVDEKPVFVTDGTGPPIARSPKRITVDENMTRLHAQAGDTPTSDELLTVTYGANDPEGINVTYSLTGPDASKFQTKGTPPVLSFKASPDYEKPGDANRDNVYEVNVRATAGGSFTERMVRVTVNEVDEAPDITTGLAVTGDASVSYDENRTDAVGTYTARGKGADSATWSLQGDDRGDFMLSGTGESRMLMFRSPPDFESRGDANRDNMYEVTVKAASGSDSDTQDVTVTVTNVAEDPAFPPSAASRSIAENTAAGENIGDAVEATPDTGATITSYALGGTDVASFDFDTSTGQIMTKAALDYETKASYSVTVTATDSANKTATVTVTITVTDVDEEVNALLQKYDRDNSGEIERHEVIAAITDYLYGDGVITRDEVIEVIFLYLSN